MDIEKAILNPRSAFECPADVLNEQSLSREQKIEVLRRWEYEIREIEAAEDNNMGGGPSHLLYEILMILHRLTARG